MKTTKRALTAAVLLSCSCLMAPFYAHASEAPTEEPDPTNTGCTHDHKIIDITSNGSLTYQIDLYDQTTHPGTHWFGEYEDENGNPVEVSEPVDNNYHKVIEEYRDFGTNEANTLNYSLGYIDNLITRADKSAVPLMSLKLFGDKDANASAESETLIVKGNDGKPIQISDSKLAAVLQGKYIPEEGEIVAAITVNLANPNTEWYLDKFPVLPSNGKNSDYYGTITHEMFHALGLGTYIHKGEDIEVPEGQNNDVKKITPLYFGTEAEPDEGDVVNPSTTIFNKYEMGIRDVFNRVVYYSGDDESPVTYDNNPINPNDKNDWARINGELKSRVIIPITIAQYNELLNNKSLLNDKLFYVLRDTPTETEVSPNPDAQLKLNNTNQLDTALKIGTNCGAYFTGKNVNDVLTTDGKLAKIAWPNGSSVEGVYGLPLNGYEGDDPELSHIELQNGLMSHQGYRNWCSFMEAELALMQDLGYDIDRSKYFGKSIYNSGAEGSPFTYINNNGFNSNQMHGIGLHVYGSYVDVTQKADINAAGDYGIGIRVDGVGNKVNIDSNISANGVGGNGLLVAYGKEHEITLNTGKTIEATGTGGVAARFDFGSNELSDEAEYRGSYFSVSYEKVTTPSGGGDEQEGSGDGTGNGTGNEAGDGTGDGTGNETENGTSNEAENGTGNSSGGTSDKEEELPPREDAVLRLQNTTNSSEQEAQYHWVQNQIPDAINGELVTNFNVAGTLKGEKAAIYISENALVKNINILSGANIQGDIISDWNPNKIKYQNDDGGPLAPNLGDKNGLTNLTFGGSVVEENEVVAMSDGQGTRTVTTITPDASFNMIYSGKIDGIDSLKMNIAGGTLDYSGEAHVYNVTINNGATLKGSGKYVLNTTANTDYSGTFTNNGTFNLGDGVTDITITGNYKQTSTGTLGVDFDTNSKSDKLNITEGYATLDGKITLTPQVDYYYNGQVIKLNPIVSVDVGKNLDASTATPEINNISPVLNFTVVDNNKKVTNNGEIVDATGDETADCDYKSTKYVIKVERKDQGYQSVATDDISSGIGSAIYIDSKKKNGDEQYILTIDKKKLLTSLDYPLTITNTDAERKKVVNNNLKKLNPNVVGSQAQAVIETHTTLNNLVSTVSSLNVGSMSMNTPVSRRIGGLGPTRVEPPKYNSWRNIVIPFSSYTDQHNGTNGYTNHNSGVIGAMERTFANGLTHGYHAAINHQSTEDSGSTIKGEGIYLGTHASYAPADWNGWSVFGSARLGVEQMRSKRTVYITNSLAPYYGRADADWTGYSGSFNIGAALTKEHGVVKSGPFAALDYSFAHRPSVHEDGGAIRTNLESATYDSLRTQLGYRLITNPKPLDSYDSTKWQAHASVAWNHELLNNNGRTSYELAEFPGTPIEDTIETYGRDSMSIAAGVIFKTPNRLDVGITLGSDIYRKGGSSIYGKATFEWKF